MAQPTSIQSGSKLFPDNATSMTVVRGTDTGFTTTVTPGRTWLKATYRTAGTDGNNNRAYTIQRHLETTGDTITFTRNLATNDGVGVTVEWQLLEFASGAGVTVQHCGFASSAATSGDITITSVGADLTHTFVDQDGSTGSSAFLSATWLEWSLTDPTTLHWKRGDGSGNVTGAAQVITLTWATVQTATISLTTDTSTTADSSAITAITAGVTALFGSMSIATQALALLDASCVMTFPDTTHVRLTRSGTTARTLTATLFAVTFTDGTTVARYAPAHGAGTGTVNTTITAITLATTLLNMANAGGVPAGIAGSNTAGRVLGTATFTTTTNLQTIKGITNSAATYQAEVVAFAAGAGTSVTGGTLAGSVQTEVVAGAKTITLQLTGDSYVAAGATFDAQRQDTIDGLTAASSPAGGWNLQVKPLIPVTAVVRTSATLVTITLPAVPGYVIAAAEVVTATIPAAALVLAAVIVSAPTITIKAGPLLSAAVLGPTNGSGVASGVTLTSDIPLTTTNGAYLELAAVNDRGTLYAAALPKVP